MSKSVFLFDRVHDETSQMQVPQVTEEVAVAVLDLYPTLFSLARAYSLLVRPLSFHMFFNWRAVKEQSMCLLIQEYLSLNAYFENWHLSLFCEIKFTSGLRFSQV